MGRNDAKQVLDTLLGWDRTSRHGHHLPLLLRQVGAREVRQRGVPTVGPLHRLRDVRLLHDVDTWLRPLLSRYHNGHSQTCQWRS